MDESEELLGEPRTAELLGPESRYNKVEVIDFKGVSMYSVPNLSTIQSSANDEFTTLGSDTRLDTIANNAYQNPKYWWVIGYANNITNPFNPLTGLTLRIPPVTELIMNEVV